MVLRGRKSECKAGSISTPQWLVIVLLVFFFLVDPVFISGLDVDRKRKMLPVFYLPGVSRCFLVLA